MSPAVNSGNTSFYPDALIATDLAGSTRFAGDKIDLGAFESPYASSTGNNFKRYVKLGGTGNGSSWELASGNLQQTINLSSTGQEVWVAQGTYQLSANESFNMKEGVKIFGGFPNNDNAAAMPQRNPAMYPTILGGSNKSVVIAQYLTSASVLDGFTLSGCNLSSGSGGGMFNWFSSPTVLNCIFSDNIVRNGGGMYNDNSSPTVVNCVFKNNTVSSSGGGMSTNNGTPIVINCTFSNNIASYSAGGMDNAHTSPIILNCTFSNNAALGHQGGGIANYNSSPVITNCVFNDNQAKSGGAVSFSSGGAPIFRNVTFTRNTASNGGGAIYVSQASPQLYNCILQGNTSSGDGGEVLNYSGTVTANNCLINVTAASVYGPFTHQNAISGDPLFTDAANGVFTLTSGSPAINSGNTALYPGAAEAEDLAGNPRLMGSQIDLGAYESIPPANGPIRYVKEGGTGNGSSWQFASGSLQQMIDLSSPGHEVWVAEGTYQTTVSQSFKMKEGVAIRGGFPNDNNAAGLAQRNVAAYTTTLKGNGRSVVNNNNNGLTGAAVLDGFQVTNGTGTTIGGGMFNTYASPTIVDCVFYSNQAANGAAIFNTYSSPVISNCTFAHNYASNNGGGIYNFGSYPKVTNSLFYGNQAAVGGADYAYQGAGKYLNCTFTQNSSTSGGGAIYGNSSTPLLYNCVFWNNLSSNNSGTEIVNSGGTITAQNCLITISATSVQGTLNHQGTISGNPMFTDPSNNVFTLTAASPAINAGSTTLFAGAEISKDLAGNPRLSGSAIDMGAYEINIECTIATTWNGNSWSDGTPISNDYAATINAAYNSADNGGITACSLTINSGNVVVSSGDVFVIKGAVTVDPDASLTFENNAHLIQDGTTNLNTGDVEVHRNSSELFRQDYTMWSSPVTGQGLRNFSEETLYNRFYSYNPVTNHLVGIFPNNEAADVDFATGQGYLIRMPNGAAEAGYVEGTTAIIYDGTFTGTPNNGTISKTVTPASPGVLGYNAIGNPYPSPISIPAFFAANNGNTDGTIYLWRRKNGSDTASAYCTINSVGEYVDNGQLETENPNGFIQTGQGFIVKALTNTVNFNNTMRSATTNHDGSFFRMNDTTTETGTENQAHRIWLTLSKEGMHVAQMLVGYRTNATMAIDMGIDAPFINDVETGLNSIIDDKAYAIQGRSLPFDAQDIVPLQFKTETAGSYSIAIDHVDGLFLENQPIYIRDKQLNETHDIKASNYSFTSDAGVFNERFEIVYIENALGTDEPQIDANTILIYKQDKSLVINSGTAVMANLKVFDTRGRLVYERDGINATETVITDLRAEEQMLIVQVTTIENSMISKKVIH